MKKLSNKILNNSHASEEIFFMNLSHEIRTPLNLIHSTVQLLEKYSKKNNCNISPNTINEHLNTIKKNNYRLYKLLNNLIYFLQINNNSHHYSPQNNDIVALVKDLFNSCSCYTIKQNKSMIFESNLEEKIIACDSFYIKKIILNLISNAIKFTKSNDKIIISVYEEDKNLCISVKDTGIGIPEEKQHTIFNTFYQIDKTIRRKNEGSGIGLAIVKELVTLHNGNIHLNSTYGQGTEFIIELPTHTLTHEQEIKNSQMAIHQSMLDMTDVELSDIYI